MQHPTVLAYDDLRTTFSYLTEEELAGVVAVLAAEGTIPQVSGVVA
jgi:hypothetical protein